MNRRNYFSSNIFVFTEMRLNKIPLTDTATVTGIRIIMEAIEKEMVMVYMVEVTPVTTGKNAVNRIILVYYCKCCIFIGYSTRYLFLDR